MVDRWSRNNLSWHRVPKINTRITKYVDHQKHATVSLS